MSNRGILSVDVEDYFQVQAFAGVVDRSNWSEYPSRVERNTERVLDLLDERGVTATFFILGWVAEHFPGLVRNIVERGHEAACHSYWHRLVYNLSPAEFQEDTLCAKIAIEQAAGVAVYGYRAPSFSITPRSKWALDVLAECGFLYDSSIFPIRRALYGFPGAPRGPFRIETQSGAIMEFPLATFCWKCGPNLPVAGGGYLRTLPAWYTRAGVRSTWREGRPVVCYIHPWELDPGQPRIRGSLVARFRHYNHLSQTEERLRDLLSLGRFTSFRDSGLVQLPSTARTPAVAP